MKGKEKQFFSHRNKQKAAIEQAVLVSCADFTTYLESKNILGRTIQKYILQIQKYETWLTARGGSPQAAQKKEILAYLQHLQERNLSPRTRGQHLGVLSHYYTFLTKNEQLTTNPTGGIKLQGTKRKILPKTLTVEEMEQLIDTHYLLKVKHASEERTLIKKLFLSSKDQQLRNHLIISFCVYQGLNRTEWRQLKITDLDLQKANLSIQAQHKTNARILPLHATQIGIIYAYLQTAREQFKLEENQLLTPRFQTDKLVKELKSLYPNFEEFTQLRASIITHWIKTEGLRKAQYKAGHRYISSTESYQANDLESLKNDINTFHPL